jgi:hypothetical protein
MIRLAGMVPYEDIDIQFTGLRPGEKLIEEIWGKSECMSATRQEKMQVIREQPLNWDAIAAWIDELEEILALRHEAEIVAHIQRLVPEYTPAARLARDPSQTLQGNGSSFLHSTVDGLENGLRERNGNDHESSFLNTGPPVTRELWHS